jgi:alpha-beta hydrolase superfamily lysophospholipase
MELVAWHPDFVAMLVARGFSVICFDNRDIGLSQRFDQFGVPNLAFDSLSPSTRTSLVVNSGC